MTTVIASTTASTGSIGTTSTSLSIAKPPGAQANDVLLVWLVFQGSTVTTTGVAADNGMVLAAPAVTDGTAPPVVGALFQKNLSGSEGANIGLSWSGGAEAVAEAVLLRSADYTAIIANTAPQSLSSTARPSPSITTSKTSRILTFFGDRNGSTWTVTGTEIKEIVLPSSASAVASDDGDMAAGTISTTATASATTSASVSAIISLPTGVATNVAPTASITADKTTLEPGQPFTLTVTNSDSDGTVASGTITQTAGVTTSLSGSSSLATSGSTRTGTAPGSVNGTTLTYSYVVTDNSGTSSTAATVSLTVMRSSMRIMTASGVAKAILPRFGPPVTFGTRATSLLQQAPPVVGFGGANVVVVAYRNTGPRRLTGTAADISESATMAAAGEDLVVLLPGRGVNLNTSPPTYGPSSSFTAGAGIYTNPQTTGPLQRKHGAQIKSDGRNLVVIGGQIDVSTDYSGSVGELPGVSPDFGMSKANRALYVLGAVSGTVHLEGISFTGTQQYETFNYNGGSGATLVWQNMRGTRSVGADGQLAGVRYLPITTGTPGSGDHDGGDWFQFNTTPRRLIVDGSHSESNWFQEFFMKVEAGQTRMDYAWIDNVASWDYQGPGGWLYLNADSGGNYCPDFRLGDNVGMQPGYQRYPVSDGVTGQRAYTTSLTNNSYPQTSQSVGLSGDSNYLTNTYYKNLDGSAGGTVWEIPMATPISATRALSIVGTGPGADYVSPGYVA